MTPAELLLAMLALGVGLVLAWGCVPVVRALMFASTLLISGLLFLPDAQLVNLAGADRVRALEQLAAETPWALSEWVHLFAFLWLTLLLWVGRADFRGGRGVVVLAGLAVAAELAQWLTEGRQPKLEDVVVNLLGVALGVALGALAKKVATIRVGRV